MKINPDDIRERARNAPLPMEVEKLVERMLDEMNRTDSKGRQKEIAARYIERSGAPLGLPTVVADFRHPDRTEREVAEYRRQWVRDHHNTIQMNLRSGSLPRRLDETVRIPIKHNIVTNRFAGRILRDIIAPSTNYGMIAQYATSGESQYKWISVNAMGVGTNSTAETTGDISLGVPTASTTAGDANQWCWYHANTGASLGAALDDDLTPGTGYGVDAYAVDSAGTVSSAFIGAADAAFTLTYGSGTNYYEFTYTGTWRFGTDGDERDGNFGSDATPVSWREIGLGNNAPTVLGDPAADTTNVRPGGTHPNLAFHLATRKVFAGNGFAKTSSVKLTNEYTVRFSSG